MKALTVDAYWAWAIIHGPKRVENRSWSTNYRGPLLIHAGKNTSRDAEAIEFLTRQRLQLPSGDEIQQLRGKIIGAVYLFDVVGHVTDVKYARDAWIDMLYDPFAFGPQCWMLKHPKPLKVPIEAKGQLGLWDYNGDNPGCDDPWGNPIDPGICVVHELVAALSEHGYESQRQQG